MEQQIMELIRKERLILPGQRILVALSGGPDSVCLFHLLAEWQEALGISLGAVHVNHGLRGMESDGEEAFVRNLAKARRIPCFIHTEDVPARARRLGQSFELAAREVRYEFFEEIMRLESYDKTALAHHRNDQAETILHRLIRGSGLNGLAGMRLERDGKYIRPLLMTSRADLEAWLKGRGLEYRLDSSNDNREYTRNRIRLELIPQLESYNPDIVSTLGQMSRSLDWDRDYLEQAAATLARKQIRQEGDKVILAGEAFGEHRAMTSRLVFAALAQLKGSRLDLSASQVEDILALAAGQTGRRLDLPGGVTVYNHYGQLEWSLKRDAAGIEPRDEVRVDLSFLPETVEFPPYRIRLDFEPPQGTATRLDVTGLQELIIRRRREGDRILLPGMSEPKKVRRIFIDRKVHREDRDRVPVFTDEAGRILYIHPGICGEAFRITQNTDKILYITVMENTNHDENGSQHV
ncbi:tRNA(Ile)-lysidine synthase [anaerobic digester metagenome]